MAERDEQDEVPPTPTPPTDDAGALRSMVFSAAGAIVGSFVGGASGSAIGGILGHLVHVGSYKSTPPKVSALFVLGAHRG